MKHVSRIEVRNKIFETSYVEVYTIDKNFSPRQLELIASKLSNPVTQEYAINKPIFPVKFNFAIEIGFLPGVTDNVGSTAREIIKDLLAVRFSQNEGVYTSKVTFIDQHLSKKEVLKFAESLYNPLIQRCHIKSFNEFKKDCGMDIVVPLVRLRKNPRLSLIDLNVSDTRLIEISKERVLALPLPYIKAIQSYFKKLGRNPTDIELESIAQTWSEHCKHIIFNSPIDEIKDGLFKTYIKGATEKIRKRKRKDDFCVSVFKDNSGAIEFDDKYLITYKVETHNSPSSLDPFGGAITGIVGVNRDTIGFGMGAKPIANFYGFCLADPEVDIPLYRDGNLTQKMLGSRRIMEGVIEGVNAGGNQSGIPTPLGFIYFDERYRGKPLVFVGTVGLIPKKIRGKLSHVKKANSGDYIVMVGGRVGKDGIHGATFSSEALSMGSPVTAVQIGDPITQKKFSDAIVKEARDMGLYNSITDNGAGGLSCSVAEMAKESGGCKVFLDKVPLKYPGLEPWEIWVSESQERMTLAVSPRVWKRFKDLMERRGVEATIIGKFTDSEKCQVYFNRKKIMDLPMEFLHEGYPKQKLKSRSYLPKKIKKVTPTLLEMMGSLNLASYTFISQQYDHIVQGNLVLGPLQGRGRVNGDTAVIRPVLNSKRGVVLSYGLYPSYSDIDTYHMAASCIDTAIRNAVAVGTDPERIALLDNFCWCSSDDPKRLTQLKKAARACYDYAVAFGTPFISGKDSMFNDFYGFDKNRNPIKISIPPTLLISSLGVIDDIESVVSLDFKMSDDLIYILGENLPDVDAKTNLKLYKTYHKCLKKSLIASSMSIGRGGLAVALAKKAIGGRLGCRVECKESELFSENQGRLVVTVAPQNQKIFEKEMFGVIFTMIGRVTKEPKIFNTPLTEIFDAYTNTFKGY